jgi:hypothetical protein
MHDHGALPYEMTWTADIVSVLCLYLIVVLLAIHYTDSVFVGDEASGYLLIPLSMQYILAPVWIPSARDNCAAMLEQILKAGGQGTLSRLMI